MKGRTGKATREPEKTISKSVLKAARPRLHGGHFGGDAPAKRPDKKSRGGDCFARGGGIHINPKHKGLLTKEVGKEGLKPKNLRKEIAKDKAKGNVAKEKREVFALNAKTKFKH